MPKLRKTASLTQQTAPPVEPTFVKPRKPWRYRWGLLIPLLLASGAVYGLARLSDLTLSVTGHGRTERVSVLTQLGRLIKSRDKQLSGESRDRINILLLGIGGPGHDGPLLADTIMLASVKPSSREVALLSVPRDLAVDIPQYGIRKINNANAFGVDLKYPGGGEQLTADIAAEITGLPVDYYARVDFTAFQDLVDAVDGIDIAVERTFTDAEYPDDRHGYRTVRFLPGNQHMDGARALEFSRSRHGTNSEGSDFARAARQQKVLVALREKAFSLQTLLNPRRVVDILNTVADHAQTNLEAWEIVRLATILRDVPESSIVTRVLDSSPNGPLKVATGQDGAFLLVPRAGLNDWQDVRSIAQNIFTESRIAAERATVVVENGTTSRGLAEAEGRSLAVLNFDVVRTGNAAERPVSESILVDFTGGAKPQTVAALAERYRALVTTTAPASFKLVDREFVKRDPDDPKTVKSGRADLLLIIGTNYTASSRTLPAPKIL
jgi:LCP family protein required for cell wall assembly